MAWRKKAKGKTISIRLYEIIYVGLLMLWSKMGKPPLDRAIYEYVRRDEYKEDLMSRKLFNKLIREIKETPCRDKTGYYLENSAEILTHQDLQKMNIEINSIVKRLTTNKIVERYSDIFEYCKQYYSWALNKKLQQSEDITEQQNFETSEEPPLKL
ncbi:MAG: hypothetical protein CMI68_00720 [Candidatus Pelagibacter sp.]|nr:hypothetical protein [Candidatus Pelagibacter sp.]